ncbi:hypothetical protein JCM3770_002387 [Rhodotorula araucariae]
MSPAYTSELRDIKLSYKGVARRIYSKAIGPAPYKRGPFLLKWVYWLKCHTDGFARKYFTLFNTEQRHDAIKAFEDHSGQLLHLRPEDRISDGLDLESTSLLGIAALVPLGVLATATFVPAITRLVLPSEWRRTLVSLVSAPTGGVPSQHIWRADEPSEAVRRDGRVWTLLGVSLAEATAWTTAAVWAALTVARSGTAGADEWWMVAAVAGIALSWVLSSLLVLPRRQVPASLQAPAPMLHFVFYLLQLAFLALHCIHLSLHFPQTLNRDLVFTAIHAFAIATLLLTTLTMPLSPSPVPVSSASSPVDPDEVPDDAKDQIVLESPERTVTLGSWIIFAWVETLIAKGKRHQLGYRDVWKLPETMQSQGVKQDTEKLKWTRIISRIFFNNSLDLILSLTLGLTSSFLSYASPFFLKQILEALTPPAPGTPYDPTLRQNAYIYALLAFVAQVSRAEVDLQQLWHERRAITRARTQLMGEVYEKALKRKDASGATGKGDDADGAKSRKKNAASAQASGKGKKAIPEARGSTSTGKIVSLMAGDVNKVANQLMSLSSIFGAPFELVIAITFLYQILGWTCLVGLGVMALALPINHVLVKRRLRIHRKMLASRDARMEILNELFQAIRFIKYSADEENWLGRVFEARKTELDWLLKTRMNNLGINALWNFSPDLVMIVSIACFTLVAHQQLTVPVAFTALALFGMVRSPMTMLPTSITQLLQTWVSIQRLEQFFDDPEVDPWASSLRPDALALPAPAGSAGEIGISHGTFKYHEKEAPSSSTATPPPAVEGEQKFELTDVDVRFPEGKLSLVCGPTGSGKTSLFLALLGEMTCVSGAVHLRKGTAGSDLDASTGLYEGVAYAAQLPWLQHDSIRNNILFGSPYEKERYEQVIEACALQADLDMFDAGDETEIGEKGISLSGGQKARVALARAVYSRAKTVLLDDPLSAVDSHTARHLFRKCLRGPLLENRTVILITHHISLCLGSADYLVRLSEGRVTLQGHVDELDTGDLTTELVEEDDQAGEAEAADASEKQLARSGKVDAQDPHEAEHAALAALAPSVTATPGASTPVPPAPEATAKRSGKLIEEEKRATGRVKWSVYNLYLRSAGYWTWAFMVALLFLGRAGRVADRAYFRWWGESYRVEESLFFRMFLPLQGQIALTAFDAQSVALPHLHIPSPPSASDDVSFWIVGYTVICLLNLAITVIGILAAFHGSFKAARGLFKTSLIRVVYAPFRYFDTTPSGRILNRYSTDFTIVDGSLTDQVRITLTHAFSFIINVGVVVIVSPRFIPPAVLIVWLYAYYALMFVKTSRDLRRLESNARSPIFSKFGETLQGIVTVRAFGGERRFLKGLWDSVDRMQAVAYSSAMSNRYLLWRFDCLGAVAVTTTIYLALVTGLSPGVAALAITSAQGLVQSIYWLCRWWSALEVDLNAVERITELLSTPQEPPQVIPSTRPPATWPSSVGGISVENLVLSYAPDLPPVVKDVSFDIPPRSKVGLVGRTGSGKSTLATSLLRFTDPTSGRIIIDGIDITSIGLHDLRSAVTLIPQEAVLFSGTVRSNLDPFGHHTDAACLEVLDRVGLINTSATATAPPSVVPSRAPSPSRMPSVDPAPAPAEPGDGRMLAPATGNGSAGDPTTELADSATTQTSEGSTAVTLGGAQQAGAGRMSVSLETPVSAGGNNFSAGQRQLLALARALLRKSRIIVMDEATASVDFQTDAKIQHTIREEFSESLVLTIAHRLRTIADYDLVLVLDQGSLVEYDTPGALLRKKDGVFRRMCEKAADWGELRRMAGLGEDE